MGVQLGETNYAATFAAICLGARVRRAGRLRRHPSVARRTHNGAAPARACVRSDSDSDAENRFTSIEFTHSVFYTGGDALRRLGP